MMEAPIIIDTLNQSNQLKSNLSYFDIIKDKKLRREI